MEEDIESKIVSQTVHQTPQWHLKRGPFSEEDFNALPQTHWTLLVQGVDRFVPEVNALLDAFDFLPQWRVDDVMISYASLHGSVGPHYDNYDVFLYQASGQRKWSLTTKNCNEKNALPDLDLRIMADFEVEEEIILSAGDMLYLPPHVGHHGVALSEDCLGYSFGYRSYQAQELWDSFGDYLSEHKLADSLYQDPNWNEMKRTAEIPKTACLQAKQLMSALLEDEKQLQRWFSRFATQLDQQAMQLLPQPLEEDEYEDLSSFISELKQSSGLSRELNCRIAYHYEDEKLLLFINGEPFDHGNASIDCVKMVANQRRLTRNELNTLLVSSADKAFIFNLWKKQYLLFG